MNFTIRLAEVKFGNTQLAKLWANRHTFVLVGEQVGLHGWQFGNAYPLPFDPESLLEFSLYLLAHKQKLIHYSTVGIRKR
jgi:hypothetical protein